MGWTRYLLGMLATIGAIVLAFELEGWRARWLWLPSAYLTIVGGTAGLLVATFPLRQLLGGFQVAVRRVEETTPEERSLALVVLSAAMRYPCGLGAIYCMIGIMAMLRGIHDPSQLGPAMSMTLVGAFFALLVAELGVVPLWFRVAAAQRDSSPAQAPPRPPATLGLTAVVFFCVFSVLLLLNLIL